jgi:hypothetical protein
MEKSFSGLVGRSGDDKVSDMGRKECLVFSHCLGAEVVGWVAGRKTGEARLCCPTPCPI